MRSIEVPAEVTAALDALHAAQARIRGLNFDALNLLSGCACWSSWRPRAGGRSR